MLGSILYDTCGSFTVRVLWLFCLPYRKLEITSPFVFSEFMFVLTCPLTKIPQEQHTMMDDACG